MTSTISPPRRALGAAQPPPRRTHGLLLTGSLRAESTTRALGEALVSEQPWLRLGPSLDRLPFYDADADAYGTPAAVGELRDRVKASALLVIVTPDYYGAVPGLVANAVDWLSQPEATSAMRGTSFIVVSTGLDESGGTAAGAALADRLERAGGIPLAPHVAVPHVADVLVAGATVPGLNDLATRTRAAARSRARVHSRTPAEPLRSRRAA